MREGVEWIFSGISSRLPLFAPGRAAHIKDTPQSGQIFPFFSKNRKKNTAPPGRVPPPRAGAPGAAEQGCGAVGRSMSRKQKAAA